MKVLKLSVLTLILVSCSSSPFEETTKEQNMVNEHLSQGVKYLEGDFDAKYLKSGRAGAYVTAVGSSIHPVETNQKMVENAAVADAKFRLTESAPSEFKKEVQRAIGTEAGGVGEFSQIDVSVSEVKNLTGIKVKYEDIQCKTRVEPTSDGGYRTMKECRSLARVRAGELKKAYDFTVAEKYGVSKSKVSSSVSRSLSSAKAD